MKRILEIMNKHLKFVSFFRAFFNHTQEDRLVRKNQIIHNKLHYLRLIKTRLRRDNNVKCYKGKTKKIIKAQ